jgi:hypothetical protein
MKINKENFEAYLLDFWEGRLSDSDKSELMAFLKNNHELIENSDFPAEVILQPDVVIFEPKTKLYRGELNAHNLEWYLAAQAEGDTTKEEDEAIEKFLQSHPSLKKQQQLFALAKLSADESIRFDNKSSLYRTIPFSLFQQKAFYYAAAAVIAVLLITGYLLFETNQPEEYTVQNVIPSAELKTHEPVKKISAPEDSLQPSLNNGKEIPVQKMEKENPRNPKPAKPIYRIMENRPLIAENKEPESIEQNNVSTTISEISSEPETNKSSLQSQKLAAMRSEITRLIASHPNAFTPDALNKLIDRMADGETEISQAELQKLLVNSQSAGPANPAMAKTPLLDALAWSLNKISGKNVSLEKKFNDDGRLVAFELDAGIFRIGKEE